MPNIGMLDSISEATLDSSFLLMQTLGDSVNYSNDWVPIAYMGILDGVFQSWFWPYLEPLQIFGERWTPVHRMDWLAYTHLLSLHLSKKLNTF